MRQILFSTFLVAFLLVGCHTHKLARASEMANLPDMTKAELLQRWQSHSIGPEWMAGQFDVSYSGEYGDFSGKGNIRMRKDSVIWANVKKFGIEAARILITRDSFFLINYINGTYMAKNLSYMSSQFNIPADFSSIQDFILGNPVLLKDTGTLVFRRDSMVYSLEKKKPGETIQYNLDRDAYLKSYKFSQSDKYLEQSFLDYQPLAGNQIFSYFRKWRLATPKTGVTSLDIHTSNIEINSPRIIRFEIPDHYQRTD